MKEISNTQFQADSAAGTFVGGETVTGGTSGYTALYRGGSLTAADLQYTSYATGATAMAFSRTTGLADGMYVTLGATDDGDAEVVTIDASGVDTATNIVTVTRSAPVSYTHLTLPTKA